MNTLQLAKKLISIPSYVDKETNEKEIADFIYNYLRKIPFLTEIKKQKVEGKRFNVIAKDASKPKLLLLGHMDTVEPRGWKKKNPFSATVKGNKLYGLGSVDMKGGIAAILSALKDFKKTRGLMLLFYCDEEYDFKGMKKFVDEFKISPKLAVSPEPSDLKIWNGARGIIKVSFQVKGKTASASRPDQGKNAILGAVGAVRYLEKILRRYKTKNLGSSNCNLAAISGGLEIEKGIVSRKGDAVPDIAQVLLDIRSGHSVLNSKIIQKALNKFLSKNSFELTNFIAHHDLKAFYLNPKKLKSVERVIKNTLNKADYLDLEQRGYQDIQIVNEKLKTPAFSLGPRGSNKHQPDEWVNIRDLDKLRELYQNLIRTYSFVL